MTKAKMDERRSIPSAQQQNTPRVKKSKRAQQQKTLRLPSPWICQFVVAVIAVLLRSQISEIKFHQERPQGQQ
jgi:hypothetical protein